MAVKNSLEIIIKQACMDYGRRHFVHATQYSSNQRLDFNKLFSVGLNRLQSI